MFAATLVLLLLASINYQLNLGYVLTFLLAGSGAVSMHVTHGTLRGLTLHRAPAPVFAGESRRSRVCSPARQRALRHRPALADARRPPRAPGSTCRRKARPARRSAIRAATRGLHALPALSIETRFPLGLFRAWAIWRPAAQLLGLPAPSARRRHCRRHARSGPAGPQQPLGRGGEMEGVRSLPARRPAALVYWKKAAKALASGGELVSRDTAGAVHQQLWLDWQACATLAPEQRLSRLAPGCWRRSARRRIRLVLPGASIPSPAGRRAATPLPEALALWLTVPERPRLCAALPAGRLPREGRDTLFLLGVIGWTVLPHVPHLPAWCGR